MEKMNLKPLEDFSETVKGSDMKELFRLRSEIYSPSNAESSNKQLVAWHNLVKQSNPECQKSRLHQFLIGSSAPVGVCKIDDLEGDMSAEAFLRADAEERDEMIKRLSQKNDKQ
jgi:hypothetical protein